MAQLNETYNVNDMPEGSGGFDPLPPGWYEATITNASLENTKAGTGQYIKCRYDITGPTHEGRVVFSNLNIRNPNPKAEGIGRQQLGDIMRAIGLPSVTDTDDLIGAPLQIKLSVKPAEGQYEASNDVKGFRAVSGSAAPAPRQSAQTQAAPVQAPAASSPPWAKPPIPPQG